MRLQTIVLSAILCVVLSVGAFAQSPSDVRRYQRDCDAENAHACWQLGLAYEYGTHVDAHNVEAVFWFRRAAALGSPEAHMSMGVMYYLGHGVPQNDDEAFGWYDAAVQLGFDGARGPLADMYASGRGVAQDLEVAIRVIEPLAASGNDQAQEFLTYLLSQTPAELIVVPLSDLITNGAQYHGREIQTEGIITFEEYGQALFLSERDYTNLNYAASIAISASAENLDERELMERTPVRFRGIYDHTCAQVNYFCSAHPAQGILSGYVSVAGGEPDDGHLPAHFGLVEGAYHQLDVANDSLRHSDSMARFAFQIVRAVSEGDHDATANLFPETFALSILGDLISAQSRPHFFFFNETAGLSSFLDGLGTDIAVAPMRFFEDEQEPVVGAICYTRRSEFNGEAPVLPPEAILLASYHDPIRCVPVFLNENQEWKIDPYIVTSHSGEYGEGLSGRGIYQRLDDPEEGMGEASGRRIAFVYHTHRPIPMFPFLHRIRERPRPRSVSAIRDGRYGYSIFFMTPSGQSWSLERVDGNAVLTMVD